MEQADSYDRINKSESRNWINVSFSKCGKFIKVVNNKDNEVVSFNVLKLPWDISSAEPIEFP